MISGVRGDTTPAERLIVYSTDVPDGLFVLSALYSLHPLQVFYYTIFYLYHISLVSGQYQVPQILPHLLPLGI